MTPIDLLIFALGIGVGLCAGWMLCAVWMLGALTGRRTEQRIQALGARSIYRPIDTLDDPDVVGDCTMPPPAPEPTDWEDFEQRTALREPDEHTFGIMPPGYARHVAKHY